jgi:hypothetical protein
MPTARLLVLLVLALVVVACSPAEEELHGLRTCGVLELDDDFGNTREIQEADVALFSRPGRYTAEESAQLTGLSGDLRHVSRTVGPCGQHDLFLGVDGDQWCAAVVGRVWDAQACWTDLMGPSAISLAVPEDVRGSALLVWAPGSAVSHILVDSAGTTVAAFVRDGLALAVLPDGWSAVTVVDFDGTTTPVLP